MSFDQLDRVNLLPVSWELGWARGCFARFSADMLAFSPIVQDLGDKAFSPLQTLNYPLENPIHLRKALPDVGFSASLARTSQSARCTRWLQPGLQKELWSVKNYLFLLTHSSTNSNKNKHSPPKRRKREEKDVTWHYQPLLCDRNTSRRTILNEGCKFLSSIGRTPPCDEQRTSHSQDCSWGLWLSCCR